MKNINKTFRPFLAIVGLLVSRKNWFITIITPAIAGQTKALGIMLGTHGRRGLLVGSRWYLNK